MLAFPAFLTLLPDTLPASLCWMCLLSKSLGRKALVQSVLWESLTYNAN